MNTEGVKSTVSFKEPKEWVLNEKEILLTKIETTTYEWTETVPQHKVLETIEPKEALYNIIKNVALMPSCAFFEVDKERILARINDIVGTTLVRTQWYIPTNAFNTTVTLLTVHEGIAEEKFHVISKVS